MSNTATKDAKFWLTNDPYSYELVRKCGNAEAVKHLWVRDFEGIDNIRTQDIDFEELYRTIKE